MPRRPDPEPAGLRHVLVAGGTPNEWRAMSPERWVERLTMLADHVSGAGGAWLTVRPMGPDDTGSGTADRDLATGTAGTGGPPASWPQGPFVVGGVTVVLRCEPDAHRHLARVLGELADQGTSPAELTESVLGAALLDPAPCEPDLAVLFGPADVLPRSLSWELAYAEVVFIPGSWCDVDPIVVKAAVAEYFTRNRRFGGVDS